MEQRTKLMILELLLLMISKKLIIFFSLPTAIIKIVEFDQAYSVMYSFKNYI